MNPHSKTNRNLALIMAFALLLSAFSMRMAARNTVIGGVAIGNFDLGGMSYAQASVLLADEEKNFLDETVQFEYGGVLHDVNLADLGFEIDEDATVEMLRDVSYGDGLIDHVGGRLVGTFGNVDLHPVVKLDRRKLIKELQSLYPALAAPKDAEIVIEGTDVQILGHKDGARIDVAAIESEILASLEHFELPGRVSVKAVVTQPGYLTSEAEADIEIVRSILGRDVTLQFHEYVNLVHESNAIVTGDWLAVKDGEILFNNVFIEDFLRNNMREMIDRPVQHAVLNSMPEEGAYGYAEVEGTAREGLTLNAEASVDVISEALLAGESEIEIVVDREVGTIVNEASDDEFVLISQGVSGYWGSPWGRRYNINKGLSETLQNVVVMPGEEFSFNENLGPVEKQFGWQDSLAIFGAEELVPVPGGGLCQVSTTLYRAVLAADMEILEQSGHTLYITYYEEFGNGLDAAIYPGYKDFRFRNTTEGPILLQGFTDGDYGYLNIYGSSPDKEVELIGPIYSGRIPERYQDHFEFIDWNEIGWIQQVTYSDGTVEENPILSRYKTAPRKLYGIE